MEKKRILIIDGQNNMYRAYFVNRGLESKGRNSGGIFGFPRIMAALIKRFNPHKVVIAWDGGRSPERLELWPEYKESRKRTNLRIDREDFYAQRNIVMELMYHAGIPQAIADDVEADDYIYTLRRKYIKQGYTVVIVSTDKDFNQLINKSCSIWSEKIGKLIHYKNAIKLNGYKPSHTIDFLCLTGDKSDNIPGYPGIGEKRAIEFLDEYSSIQEYLDSDTTGKLDKELLAEIYERNRKLIGLHIFSKELLDKPLKLRYYKKAKLPEFNPVEFFKICDEYGMSSISNMEFFDVFKSVEG